MRGHSSGGANRWLWVGVLIHTLVCGVEARRDVTMPRKAKRSERGETHHWLHADLQRHGRMRAGELRSHIRQPARRLDRETEKTPSVRRAWTRER